jgi:outer membrane immunogenic protein
MRSKTVTLLAVAASLGLAQAASAADMPARMPAKAPMAALAPINWSGFYVGGFVGGAWAANNAVSTDPCLVASLAACAAAGVGSYNTVAPTPYNLNGSFIGGATLGYNLQSGMWVYGLEGELGYMHLHGSVVQNPLGSGDTSAEATIGSLYGIVAGRLGWVWDRTLIYVKGGAVAVRVNDGVVDNRAPTTLDTRTSTTRWGGAIGGGVEYAMNPKWRLKLEYQYLAIGFNHDTQSQVGGFPPGTIDQVTTKIPNVHTVKLGVNYAF